MSLTFDLDELTKLLDKSTKVKSRVMQKAFNYYRQITPIRSGYARRNTRLSGDVIVSQYPYAGRLDDGYSNQAPDGMTRPTEKLLNKLVKEELRGLK